MTFHCKNYDINKDGCRKLNGECVPGRKGCVLEGRVAVTDELAAKIREVDARVARRAGRKQGGRE